MTIADMIAQRTEKLSAIKDSSNAAVTAKGGTAAGDLNGAQVRCLGSKVRVKGSPGVMLAMCCPGKSTLMVTATKGPEHWWCATPSKR